MTTHASRITEYGRIAISNNFTLDSGIDKLSLEAFICKFSGLTKFWISWNKCIIWANHFFFFHIQRYCQDGDPNTKLRKLTWLKRSACPYCPINQLTVTKSSNGIRFCLQGFASWQQAKIATPIWLWRREVLVHEVQSVFCCSSHVIMRFAVRQ